MPIGISATWGSLPNPFTYSDIVAFVQSLGLEVSGPIANDDIAAGAVTAGKVTPGAFFYGAGALTGATGSKAYVVTLTPALPAYAAGVLVVFQADLANEGGPGVTTGINVNGLGAKYLRKADGSELDAGEIAAGAIVAARYDGTQFQVLSTLSRPALRRCGNDTSSTVNQVQVTLTPSTLTLTDLVGQEIEFTLAAANTGAVTVQVNSLAAKALKKAKDQALAEGDLKTGQVIRCVYDGTNFQLLTPAAATFAGVAGQATNLVVAYATGATVTVTADELVLKNAAGAALVVPVNVTVNMGLSGAGGLDTGAEITAGGLWWYSIWIISDGTNVAGLFSYAPGGVLAAPTLPAGYTYKAHVGYVGNSSGNFRQFYQQGRRVAVPIEAMVCLKLDAYTDLDFLTTQPAVPAAAKTIFGFAGTTAVSGPLKLDLAPDSAGTYGVVSLAGPSMGAGVTWTSINGGMFQAVPFEVGCLGNGRIYGKAPSALAGTLYVVCTGYTF